jgi:hypothetical protein
MNAIDAAVKSFIEADTDPGGMSEPDQGATGGVHQGTAPQNAPFPRYHFQEIDDIALYSLSRLVADHCFYALTALAVDDPVNGGREGAYTAGRLIERARTKFTDPNGLTVDGKTLLYCRYRNALAPGFEKDTTQDRYIYSKGMVLEIWLA